MGNKKESIGDKVYQYLLDDILSMKIKPGEKIPEEGVAKKFGISRAPVRDAIKRLSNYGIVNIYPRRFAVVADYSDEEFKQIGVVRIFFELAAIKLCTLYGNKAELMRLLTISKECYEAAKNNDLALRIRKDTEFHFEFSKISKNQQLIRYADDLYMRIDYYQACKYGGVEPDAQYNQHTTIVEALINGDEETAKKALVKHLSSFHTISEELPISFFLSE